MSLRSFTRAVIQRSGGSELELVVHAGVLKDPRDRQAGRTVARRRRNPPTRPARHDKYHLGNYGDGLLNSHTLRP